MASRLVLDDRDALDKAAAELAALFAQAELDLRRALALQVRLGLVRDPGDVLRHLHLARLRADTATIVARLLDATPAQVDRILVAAARDGAGTALRELSRLAGVADITAVLPAAPGALAAQALTLDLVSTFEDVTRRILRWPDDVYRRAVAGPTSELLLGLGQTTHTAQAKAWQRLIAAGPTSFVDKAGRRWKLHTYVEMATRTAARRAWGTLHEQTMLDHGIDLVSVVVGSDACQKCAQWAGRILRINPGPVGRLELPRVDGPGTVVVDVHGTLDSARDQGWQHPNCRCRPVAYLPGLPATVDATTYDEDLEEQREKLRALEREVREAKVEEASAVTDAQKTEARSRVRALQAQIREHVAQTGLNRKRYREQTSLGRRIT